MQKGEQFFKKLGNESDVQISQSQMKFQSGALSVTEQGITVKCEKKGLTIHISPEDLSLSPEQSAVIEKLMKSRDVSSLPSADAEVIKTIEVRNGPAGDMVLVDFNLHWITINNRPASINEAEVSASAASK